MPFNPRRVLLTATILCLGGLSAQAQGLPDAQLILPPPPLAGSPRAMAEVEELKHYQATSTPEALAAAAYDDKHEDGTIFMAVLGPAFDLARLPATVAMLAAVGKAESAATNGPKAFFHRDRPWVVDPAIKTCTAHKPGPAANSYPSGHTTVGFAMAEVLAALIPAKAQQLLARAGVFAENRLVCGYHFRSDIVAGQELGTLLAQNLMQDRAFQAQMAAARSELQGAHVIP
jgi:membrane-associated phospholipid phosphatase